MTKRLSTAARERSLILVEPPAPPSRGPAPTIRVLVAHGDGLVRAGLGALLDAEPGVEVAGAAADGSQAIALARELHPDVLLLDASVPGLDALTVTRRILADSASCSVRVLAVGASDEGHEIFPALRAGASGFMVRNAEPPELMNAIRAVAAGEGALSPSGIRRLIDEVATHPDPPQACPEVLEELTPRELEVMALVAGGLSNDEIAEQLVVSPATAKTHVSRVMSKLQARHRAQIVTLAYETGLVHATHAAEAAGDAFLPAAA